MALDVEVGVKNARFRSGLEQMRGQAKQFSGDLKGMLLGAFSIAGIEAFAEKMREVEKEANRFGTSAETVQRIGVAAKQSEVDFEMLAKAMNKVTIEAGHAARGGEEQSKMFATLGIDAKRFIGLSPDKKLLELSRAFVESRGSGEKTTAMLDLLGERGAEIAPMLARGPEALAKSMGDATIQTNGTVKAFADLDRSIKKMEGSAGKVLGKVISVWGNVVASVSAHLNTGQYEDAAQIDLDTENMRRRHAGQAQITGSDAQKWKSNRAREILDADEKGALEDVDKDVDAAGTPAAKDDFKQSEGKNSTTAIAALKKDIAEEEARNRADALTGEARINELLVQRAALASKINENTAEGLEAKKQDLGLEREIADLKKSHAERLQEARTREADLKEKQALDKMSPQERLAYLQKKQQALFAQASHMDAAAATDKNADPVKAIETRIKAEELQPEIDELLKGDEPKEKKSAQRVNVAVDSLQRAGGGGGVGPSSDPMLRAQDKAQRTLEQIRDALTQGSGAGTRPAPNPY